MTDGDDLMHMILVQLTNVTTAVLPAWVQIVRRIEGVAANVTVVDTADIFSWVQVIVIGNQ